MLTPALTYMVHVKQAADVLGQRVPVHHGRFAHGEVWRDASNTPGHRAILPIELLAVQGQPHSHLLVVVGDASLVVL